MGASHKTDRRRNITSTLGAQLSRVEAGSDTSTVTLRVVVGDEKGVSNLRE
jgi:hypothetical protein